MKSNVNIFELARSVPLENAYFQITGRELQLRRNCYCPFCGRDKFNAKVEQDRSIWSCWRGCAKGRDAIDLFAAFHRVTLRDAAVMLVGDSVTESSVNVRKPITANPEPVAGGKSQATRTVLSDSADWQSFVSEVVRESIDALWTKSNETARRARLYLNRERLLSVESIQAYRFGLNHRWREKMIDGVRVTVAPGIVLPWTRPGGFAGGQVREFHEKLDRKYIMFRGSSRNYAWPGPLVPFDSGEWWYHGVLAFVEGEFDAAVLQQAIGGIACVKTIGGASSSVMSLVESEREQISKFSTLAIIPDNDEAGNASWQRWQSYTRAAKRLRLPDGFKDCTSAAKNGIDLRIWFESELRRLRVCVNREAGT